MATTAKTLAYAPCKRCYYLAGPAASWNGRWAAPFKVGLRWGSCSYVGASCLAGMLVHVL